VRVVGRDRDSAEDSVEDATTDEVDDSTTAAEEAGAAELAGAADLAISDRSYRLVDPDLRSSSFRAGRDNSLGRRSSGTRLWSGRARLGSLRGRLLLGLRRLRLLRGGRCGGLGRFLRRRLGSRLLGSTRGCRGLCRRGRSLGGCGRSRFRS